MTQGNSDKVIATLTPSPIRRIFGIGGLVTLGMIILYVALVSASSSLVTFFTLVIAVLLSFVLAYRMYMATSNILELKRESLVTSSGELVARIDNVERVEMGLFVMKPSNGFLIVLKEPMKRRWQPGLWWRFGRRIGVGGVTSRGEGKIMSDALLQLLLNDHKSGRSQG